MNKHSLKIMVSTLVVSLSAIMARADYSNEVESLNPAAYWPMQETKAPPAIYYATNSGTLGGQADGYYNNIYNRSGATYDPMSYFTGPVAGVTSDGAAASFFNGGTNDNNNAGYMLIPDINNDLDPGIPFSAEVWVKPGGGDPNDVTGKSFASTEWAPHWWVKVVAATPSLRPAMPKAILMAGVLNWQEFTRLDIPWGGTRRDQFFCKPMPVG